MKRVLKWPVPVDGRPHAVGRGQVAHVGSSPENAGRTDRVDVWTIEDDRSRVPDRAVQVFGTGHEVPESAAYLGSVVVGPLVWHVFEVAR